MKLLEVLKQRFTLMVSLPRNEVDLARAAVSAGAQCIKVHINCHHYASDTHFGSLSEERPVLEKILEAVDVPVGIVTGETTQPGAQELTQIEQMGFDFWDLFANYTSPDFLLLNMGKMVAINNTWTPDLVRRFHQLGVDVIESSIIPRTEYRSPLNLTDLAAYSRLAEASPMPILIPTQKKIEPSQVQHLKKVGAAGITIGAVVTGLECSGLEQATAAFRGAIDAL